MNLHELFDLEILPINLQTRIQKLVTSSDYDVLIDTAVDLVDSLRLLLIEHHTGNAENEVELDVLQEGSTHGLSYANKIRKAAGKEDIFGVGYAVHDLIRNMKLDLIKLEGNFDKSTTLQLPTERQQVYEELGYPDVHHAITYLDFDTLLDHADLLEEKLLEKFPKDRILDTIDDLQEYLSNI